jgi:hypothetical protein
MEILFVGGLFSVLSPGFQTHCSSAVQDSNFDNYTFVFFTPLEKDLMEKAMEIIIPRDEHSAGAGEAKVPAFADLMVSTGDDLTQKTWRDGLRLLAEAANGSSVDAVLASLAAKEHNPQSDLERFWPVLKLMTVRGYYTSRIGIHQDMEYVGNEYLVSAPACNHLEHQ